MYSCVDIKIGDLLHIKDNEGYISGIGIYLGRGSRGTERQNDPDLLEAYWCGRIATFDAPYWIIRKLQ